MLRQFHRRATHALGSESTARLLDLVLIRHGESEGNVARNRSIRGDHSLFVGEFKNRHSALWRLTDRGREQAVAAGEWLKENNLTHFDRYYVSEYLRAMETAARLNLPDPKWYAEMLIRERDWGQMDLMSEEERMTELSGELKRLDLDPFYYSPPGGESLSTVAQRSDRLISSLHRECDGKRVIVVCHGEVMWAMRTRLERMSLVKFRDLYQSGRMVDQIQNGHILHYTRRDPFTGEISPFFNYMRSVCPWDQKLSPKGWIKFKRPVYDNDMLLAFAERVPRMITSDEYVNEVYSQKNTIYTQLKASSIMSRKTSRSVKTQEKKRNIPVEKAEPMKLKKVVISNKMTRFEHEQQIHGNTGDELRKQIALRGFVYDRLKNSHTSHTDAVNSLVSSLHEANIETKIISARDLTREDIEGASAVFSTGGDGTFLQTASFVTTDIPVIGLNTDPTRSEGNLCCWSLDPTAEAANTVVSNLLAGEFQYRHRQRIRISLIQQDGTTKELPRFALNEVFVSESDPARPTFYDLGVDQDQRETQRSSGIIVSTGTGSSAWYHNACKIHREQVTRVLKELHHIHSSDVVTEVTERYVYQIGKIISSHGVKTLSRLNNESLFNPMAPEMGYIVREPIVNATFGDIRHRRGRVSRVSIRSLGWDVLLHVDGMYSVPLDYGVQAVFTIGKDPGMMLKTVKFMEDESNSLQ